jgi:hypothetical protein
VEAPLSMTMGVEPGKRAKSFCRGGRWTGAISPGGGGGERCRGGAGGASSSSWRARSVFVSVRRRKGH